MAESHPALSRAAVLPAPRLPPLALFAPVALALVLMTTLVLAPAISIGVGVGIGTKHNQHTRQPVDAAAEGGG